MARDVVRAVRAVGREVEDVACPFVPVVAVHEYACGLNVQAANVALAPLLGAVKVTATPKRRSRRNPLQ